MAGWLAADWLVTTCSCAYVLYGGGVRVPYLVTVGLLCLTMYVPLCVR